MHVNQADAEARQPTLFQEAERLGVGRCRQRWQPAEQIQYFTSVP